MSEANGSSLPGGTGRAASNGDTPSRVTSQVGPWAFVPVWVFTAGLTPGEFKVYVALRSYCDVSGDCFPMMKKVADRAGCSLGSVRNAIQRFRKLGLLTTTEVWRDGTHELAYLRYHLVDVKPVAPMIEGVHPTVDTPTPQNVGVSTPRLTQEHTTEYPMEETTTAASQKLGGSASTLPRGGRVAKQKIKDPLVEDLEADDAEAVEIAEETLGNEGRSRRLARFLRGKRNASTTAGHMAQLERDLGIEAMATEADAWDELLDAKRAGAVRYFNEQLKIDGKPVQVIADAMRSAYEIDCRKIDLGRALDGVADSARKYDPAAYLNAIAKVVARREVARMKERIKRTAERNQQRDMARAAA